MKYLQMLNWALLLAGAAITTVLSVVCVMLWVHQSQAASAGSQTPPVLAVTAAFAMFSLAAGAAVWSLRYRGPRKWLAQALLVIAAAGLVWFIRGLG